MRFYVAIFAFLLPALFAFAGAPEFCRPQPHKRDGSFYVWTERHAAVKERNRTHPPEIVCIGDSLFHYWGGEPADYVGGKASPRRGVSSWNKLFAGKTVTNMGFGYDTTDNVYFRILDGELDGINPKIAVLLIGANDINFGVPADLIEKKYAELLSLIRERLPQTKILIIAIPPAFGPEYVREAEDVNDRIRRFADPKKNVFYADIAVRLRGDGGLPNLTYYVRDRIHPNATGYAAFGEQLAIEFNRIEKSSPQNKTSDK